MNEILQNSSFLSKAIFHYFNPREKFTCRNGLHARDRFVSRYGEELSQKEYEMINVKILLGDYTLLASEDVTSALYTGFFKGIKFYAIFQPNTGNVVTFLEEGMVPSFLLRDTSEIHALEDDIVFYNPNVKSMSESFIFEDAKGYELELFDSHHNYSIYRGPDNDLVLYGHSQDLILRKSRNPSKISEYIELNFS